MTIDPVANQVWLGDVGQGQWEEVDRVNIGGNYGWDCREGAHDFENPGNPDQCTGKTLIDPEEEYGHGLGQAVTGGVVYRGDDMPELYGWYVYADFYSGRIWAIDTTAPGAAVQLVDTTYNISSFTLLPDGEIAVVTYNDGVRKLAP
jgi:glucose/arabinose dehydrogenase